MEEEIGASSPGVMTLMTYLLTWTSWAGSWRMRWAHRLQVWWHQWFTCWQGRVEQVHGGRDGHIVSRCDDTNDLPVDRDELSRFMEEEMGASSPGVMTLTTYLSRPFQQIERYSSLLKELERHSEVHLIVIYVAIIHLLTDDAGCCCPKDVSLSPFKLSVPSCNWGVPCMSEWSWLIGRREQTKTCEVVW